MFNKYILLKVEKKKGNMGLINPIEETYKSGIVQNYDLKTELPIKKGKNVLYQGGQDVIIDKQSFVMIREDQLICLK